MPNRVKPSGSDIPSKGFDILDPIALQAFEFTPQEIFIWDTSGKIIFANQRSLVLHGFTLERLRTEDFRAELYHPDDLPIVLSAIKKAVAQGEPMAVRARLVRHDGPYFWYLVRANPVLDANGRIYLWYGTATDIDDVVRAEDRLRLTIDTTPAMVLTAQPDGELDYFNQRWMEYLGVPLEEVLGWRWASVIHPDERETLVEKWRVSVRTGEPFEAESRVRRADGSYRWFIHRTVPLRDEQGNITKWYGSSMDVDDRKRTEAALQRSEALLTEGQKISRTGSWVWNPDTQEMLSSKERFRIFGLDPEITKPSLDLFLERVHPEDISRFKEAFDSAVHEKRGFDQEYRIVTPDGVLKHIRSMGHAVLNESGGLVEFIGTTMDVTEQKRTQEAIRAAKARFEGILEIAEDAIISVDTDQHIVLFNQGAERVFGYTSNEVIGKPLDVLLPESFAHSHREHINGFAKSPDVSRKMGQRREVFGRRKNGTEFPAEASISKLALGSDVVFTVILRDVTERKRAEEAVRRSEAFLSEGQRLSHTGSFGWSVATDEHYWSDETFRIWGYDKSTKITLQKILDRIHPQDLQNAQNTISTMASSVKDFELEYRLLMSDRSVKYVHVVAHAVREESGRIEYIGAVMDITERKQAEEALRRSETLLAEGERISHTGSFSYKPATGELTSSKERFRIFGLDPEKTPCSAFSERVHPDDKSRLRKILDAAILEKKELEFEYRIVTPDWVIKYVHTVAHPITNEAGELVEFIGSTTDITERKRAEERAQSHNEAVRLALNSFVEELDLNRFLGHVITGLTKQFQAKTSELWLFEESSSAAKLFMTCEQGKVVWADETQPTGLPPRATHSAWERPDIGRIPRIIELPAQKSLLRPTHIESLKQQGIKTLLLVPLVLGEQNLGFVEVRFPVATRLTPDDVNLAQALLHHATLALQLSRLAHRTEQMAVTEERYRLAREIHDTLAQAFAGIVLHTEALKSSSELLKARNKKALSQIEKLARSGLDEARRSVQALRPRALDDGTLPQALEQLAAQITKDAKLVCRFTKRGTARTLSMEVQDELFRIAQEAMTNVRKHARAKSVRINLESKSNRVILSVQDNGIGMGKNDTPKRKLGYGLASMRERAQRIGGRFEIDTHPNRGTKVCVSVTLRTKAAPTARIT